MQSFYSIDDLRAAGLKKGEPISAIGFKLAVKGSSFGKGAPVLNKVRVASQWLQQTSTSTARPKNGIPLTTWGTGAYTFIYAVRVFLPCNLLPCNLLPCLEPQCCRVLGGDQAGFYKLAETTIAAVSLPASNGQWLTP